MPTFSKSLFCILGCALLAAGSAGAESLLHRGGVDTAPRDDSRFRVDLGVAVAAIDIDTTRLAPAVTPRFELARTDRLLLDLALPVWWLDDPYSGSDPRGEFCPSPGERCLLDERFLGLGDESPGAGSSIAVAPSLEWTFLGRCWQPSVFVGGGAWRDRSQTSSVQPLGVFTSEAVTSPLLTAGVALRRRLTEKHFLRFEARVLTTFYDDVTVTGPGGIVAEKKGETLTSAFFSVSLQFGF